MNTDTHRVSNIHFIKNMFRDKMDLQLLYFHAKKSPRKSLRKASGLTNQAAKFH